MKQNNMRCHNMLTYYILEEYVNCDVDLNGQSIYQGINNDPNLLFFNVLSHPDNTLGFANYIIEEQLP